VAVRAVRRVCFFAEVLVAGVALGCFNDVPIAVGGRSGAASFAGSLAANGSGFDAASFDGTLEAAAATSEAATIDCPGAGAVAVVGSAGVAPGDVDAKEAAGWLWVLDCHHIQVPPPMVRTSTKAPIPLNHSRAVEVVAERFV
jgi:hypothetical protein